MNYYIDKVNKREYLISIDDALDNNGGSESILHEGYLGEALLAIIDLPLVDVEQALVSSISANLPFNLSRFLLSPLQLMLLRHLELLWERHEQLSRDARRMVESRHDLNKWEFLSKALASKHTAYNLSDLEFLLDYIGWALRDERLYDKDLFLFYVNMHFSTKAREAMAQKNPLNMYKQASGLTESAYVDKANEKLSKDELLKRFATFEQRERGIKIRFDEAYAFSNIAHLALVSFYKIVEYGMRLKPCANCGRAFIPILRSDAIYCSRISPQDGEKSCKVYGSRKAYTEALKTNESKGLKRKIYMQKQMLAKRNPDIAEYRADFELFKKELKVWRDDLAYNIKTEEEYISWLNARRKKGATQ